MRTIMNNLLARIDAGLLRTAAANSCALAALISCSAAGVGAECGLGDESDGVPGCECRVPTTIPAGYPVQSAFEPLDECPVQQEVDVNGTAQLAKGCCWTESRNFDDKAFNCWCRYAKDTEDAAACQAYADTKPTKNTFVTVVEACDPGAVLAN